MEQPVSYSVISPITVSTFTSLCLSGNVLPELVIVAAIQTALVSALSCIFAW
ncbi:hypothetical protein L9H26_14570 [Morganella psychrotolerans]|uniref:hypothetical protein n=1 Tax=Morganella psychrotolerans TaxID=368603 RepID=UPI00138FB7E8|nr:hypothetical protein [Morganella psychrotolerans]